MRKLPSQVWLILFGTFLTSATYWMSWPFLAVILNQQYHLTASVIGGIFSFSILLSTLLGVYLGSLSDKVGRSFMMSLGCAFSILGFCMLAFSNLLILYVLSILFISISKALLDPLGKAIFGDIASELTDRSIALQLRYFVVNLGAAFGPLCGVYIGIAMQQPAFLIAGFSYLIYFFLLSFLLAFQSNKNAGEIRPVKIHFFKIMRIIMEDRSFLSLVLANILLWIVFAQFESTLSLYFSVMKVVSLAKFIGILVLANTVTILLFQFPLVVLLRRTSVSSRIYLSIIILSISQIMFAFSSLDSYYSWIISTFIFSIAEVILVPNLNILIDQMAPANLRGSYFAVSNLYRIGFGSYIGGLLLEFYSGRVLFFVMSFLCIFIGMLYFYSSKSERDENLDTYLVSA